MANIYHQVLIHADRKTVYDAVTAQEGLSRWWIANCTVKPEVGFMNKFFTESHHTIYMKVVAMEPHDLVEWECLKFTADWVGTKVIFTLSDRGEYTCLDFKHTGHPAENELYAISNYHWARHLFMLKVLCETSISLLDKKQEEKECTAALQGKV